jgi:hypothetical protein
MEWMQWMRRLLSVRNTTACPMAGRFVFHAGLHHVPAFRSLAQLAMTQHKRHGTLAKLVAQFAAVLASSVLHGAWQVVCIYFVGFWWSFLDDYAQAYMFFTFYVALVTLHTVLQALLLLVSVTAAGDSSSSTTTTSASASKSSSFAPSSGVARSRSEQQQHAFMAVYLWVTVPALVLCGFSQASIYVPYYLLPLHFANPLTYSLQALLFSDPCMKFNHGATMSLLYVVLFVVVVRRRIVQMRRTSRSKWGWLVGWETRIHA